jgi:hypothetical protein
MGCGPISPYKLPKAQPQIPPPPPDPCPRARAKRGPKIIVYIYIYIYIYIIMHMFYHVLIRLSDVLNAFMYVLVYYCVCVSCALMCLDAS